MADLRSYKTRNRLLFITAPLLLIFCYFLALKPTVDAVGLNKNLHKQVDQVNHLSADPVAEADRLRRINTILNQYKADTTAWRDGFWMQASHLASINAISIIYDQKNSIQTVGNDSMISGLEIQFVGKYHNLLRLIDSMEKSRGLGLLSSLEMSRTADVSNTTDKNVIAKTRFKVMSR
jgi:hypothetical protein